MTQCKFPLSQCGAIILRQHGFVPQGMTSQYLTELILLLLVAANPLKTDCLWASSNIYMDKSPLNYTPSEEKDILVCIITATQLSCNYKGTWFDRTSQG